MIRTLNPYSNNTAKTAEIMSRYRPIAPKPPPELDDPAAAACDENMIPSMNMMMSHKISQSPYLRNLWPQMQSRPTRTRKRGRPAISPPAFKRPRSHVFTPPPALVTSPSKSLILQQGFAPQFPPLLPNLMMPPPPALNCGFETPPATTTSSSIVTLPLLPSSSSSLPVIANQATELSCMGSSSGEKMMIDLNTVAEIPEEDKDDLLLQMQLQAPPTTTTNVISPQPIRPVGSSISVGCISEDPAVSVSEVQAPHKKPAEEVEEEVELEALPAVISDSNNRVRMANSAYKEMVGQPECSWLDSMVSGGTCKRISGEVMLHFSDSTLVPLSSKGFSCWVRIEWGGSDGKKSSINAFCDVIRLSCLSKDYRFSWRFHTHAPHLSQFITNV